MTINNLRKMKVWILDWCYICKCNGELVDHLFLHCPVAMDLWAMVLGLFGVSWVMPQSVLGLLRVLARQVWSSSKWFYLDNCIPLLNVVSLEGEK